MSLPLHELKINKHQNEVTMMDDEVDVTEDLKKAVSALEPERTNLFSEVLDRLRYEQSKKNVSVIRRFVENNEIEMEGVSSAEIRNCHQRFVEDFWNCLH